MGFRQLHGPGCHLCEVGFSSSWGLDPGLLAHMCLRLMHAVLTVINKELRAQVSSIVSLGPHGTRTHSQVF